MWVGIKLLTYLSLHSISHPPNHSYNSIERQNHNNDKAQNNNNNHQTKWSKPQVGTFKANCDANLTSEDKWGCVPLCETMKGATWVVDGGNNRLSWPI
jgi:hypothetical protein